MAQGENKEINQLEQATEIQDADLFVLEQEGDAKKLLGSTLKSYAEEAGINAIREIYPRTPASNDPDNSVFVVEIPDAGEAPIHSTVIKGKTVAVNQLASVKSATVTPNGTQTYSTSVLTMQGIKGHRYYVATKVTGYNGGKTLRAFCMMASSYGSPAQDLTGTSAVFEWLCAPSANTTQIAIGLSNIVTSDKLTAEDAWTRDDTMVIDLTAEGYTAAETTNVATFKAAFLRKNGYPLPQYISYDSGSLANVNGTYRMRGKNMLDNSKVVLGYYINKGEYVRSATNAATVQDEWIKVSPSTTYTISSSLSIQYLRIHFYDANHQACNPSFSQGTSTTSLTFTTPSDCAYVKWSFNYNSTTITQDVFDSLLLQIELGSIATAYEPYYNGGTIDCSAEPLNGVGTAQDEKDSATGKRSTRCGMVDLGTLTYTKQTATVEGVVHTYFTSTSISGIMPISSGSVVGNILCAMYRTSSRAQWINNTPCIFQQISDMVVIADDAYANATADDFKTAMSGVMLCYELATPVVSTETPQPVYTQYGYNCFEPVSGGVQSAEVDTVYYENIAGYIDKKLAEA